MFFLFAGKLYILEVNKIFCAISLLEFVSNRLVSKRLRIETTGFRFERTNPSDPWPLHEKNSVKSAGLKA